MQQPELGQRLISLRKEKTLTQEELAEKSHVSVRTIQRIEAGEVLPRMSTVKILLEALGESFESFTSNPTPAVETQTITLPIANRNTLLIGAIAGGIYLVCQIVLGAMDLVWLTDEYEWKYWMTGVYATVTVVMVASFTLFGRGFISLSNIFENPLLRVSTGMLIVATTGKAIMDVTSLMMREPESLWAPYAATAVLFGALNIIFGVALIRLQDGMGEISRIAGLLEILMGCLLVTVILFFITYVIMVPAIVVEILVLYKGYEYLSKPAVTTPS